ncbi:hypothetical protein ACEU59_07505 [Buttiauxella noackiae]|uniref:hypothetical protein n=1 Tax=Buttiauxella noackiae TaxID=82992 RepID=UPI0035A70C40
MKTQIHFKKTITGQFVISDAPADITINCNCNSYDSYADICCYLYNSQFSSEPELFEALTFAARIYNVEVSR